MFLALREPSFSYVAVLALVLLVSSPRLYRKPEEGRQEKQKSGAPRRRGKQNVNAWFDGGGGSRHSYGSREPDNAGDSAKDCPYGYILGVYGKGHFAKIVDILDPPLKSRDKELYALILDVMDAIHFGAILVDDVADGSVLRKGKPAAHHIYGPSETINRAYLRIHEMIKMCSKARPSFVPFILEGLTEIHKGQDDSLVWRRDGLPAFLDKTQALDTYRHCASLKTGALFRLVGQLVHGSHEKDGLMSRVGWYCHLQNDCKNVYAADVVAAKGTLAEDLSNGEYSFPIISALYSSPAVSMPVKAAFHALHQSEGELKPKARDQHLRDALDALQAEEVRNVCLAELEEVRDGVKEFAVHWGRHEEMQLEGKAMA